MNIILDSISGLELKKFTHADIIEDNEKKLGKSCLIDINCDEGQAEIGRIRILLDNKASYFSKDFLEVDPIYEDSFCTEKAVKSVLGIVDSSLKKDHPRERQLIRNSFILYMRRNDFIDYDDMVKEIFINYFDSESCEIDGDTKLKISKKLEELPEKQKFSRQFNRISENITAKLTKVEYKLAEDLELIINGAKIQDNLQQDTDLFDRVIAGEENDGRSFLKIYTNNEDALNTFRKKE